MAANFDRFSHAVGLLSEVGAVLGVPTTDVAKAMNLLVALSEKHQGAKMADRVKLPKLPLHLFHEGKTATATMKAALDFLRGRALSLEALQDNGKVFCELVAHVFVELKRQRLWIEPRVEIEAESVDQLVSQNVARIVNEHGAPVVQENGDIVVVVRSGATPLFERNTLQTLFATAPGRVRVHRVGSPASYDFDCDATEAPPVKVLPVGRRVSNQFVIDLERFNEWPYVSDYLLEEMEEVKQEGKSSIKRQQTAPPSKVRGELGGVKRVKTDPAMAAAIVSSPSKTLLPLAVEQSSALPVLMAPVAIAAHQIKLVLPSSAAWFSLERVSQEEREGLPEFFSGNDPLKTPQVYKDYRDFMVHAYWQSPTQHLTFTACRRNLVGDVGAILRVHRFLERRGIINHQVTSTTVPTGIAVPAVGGAAAAAAGGGAVASVATAVESQQTDDGSGWTTAQTLRLLGAIEQFGDDWVRVANAVGDGKSAHDCVLHFVRSPEVGGPPAQPDVPMEGAAGILAYLAAVMPPEVASGAAAAAAKYLREATGQEGISKDAPQALAAVALAAAGERAGKLAETEASRLGMTLGKAVGLLLKGLHARLERFDELERNVVARRDSLRRETLALLARSTAPANTNSEQK